MLAKEYSSTGLFHLGRYVNADELLQKLKSGVGIPFDEFGLTVVEAQFRDRLISGHRLPPEHPFLSSFRIEKSRLTAPADALDGYLAAAIADFLRDELLAAGTSFSFETVMSHRSKVEFLAKAHADGYRTYLYFIAVESPEINQHRVETRVREGGHDVPQQKINERYGRSLDLLTEALKNADRAYVFDNSGIEPRLIAEKHPDGILETKMANELLPMWFKTAVLDRSI